MVLHNSVHCAMGNLDQLGPGLSPSIRNSSLSPAPFSSRSLSLTVLPGVEPADGGRGVARGVAHGERVRQAPGEENWKAGARRREKQRTSSKRRDPARSLSYVKKGNFFR